jgi:hypothetical protein
MKKYILRFLPDYNCTSLWQGNKATYEKYGMMIKYSEVGLSSLLISELEKFDESIMDIIDWNDPGGSSPLSVSEIMDIYNNGQRLLSLIRNELNNDFEIIDCSDWIKPKAE